jgi:UDP-N-acetylmuramate dehydrogenase
MKILNNYSLKKHNTFGIDVKAKYFADVSSVDELRNVLINNKIHYDKKLILGGGSNILLVNDFDGLVIKNSLAGINILSEDKNNIIVEAGAGVIWDELVQYCVDKNLRGIENLSYIPGSVGAAPIQNIGAYGQELKDAFFELKGIFTETSEEKIFDISECDFSYRNSIFKTELKDKFIITSVKLNLNKIPQVNTSYKQIEAELKKDGIDNPTLKDVRNTVIKIRNRKLPDPKEIGNAGSFFKNPIVAKEKYLKLKKSFQDMITYHVNDNHVKIAAGWLIEYCGWKGKRIGNVGTYKDHALVIVNYGNATGDEIFDFEVHIKHSVELKFGIRLENEVNIIS